MDFDVVVTGASLSGATAAILLARAGWRVALVDQAERAAAYKVLCSHHIHISATDTLHRLGLEQPLQAAGAIRNGIHAWTRWNWIRPQVDASRGWPAHGYNVRRQVLDPLLRMQAATTPGVTLLLGHKVEDLLVRDGRIGGVKVRHAGGVDDIGAALVVGADRAENVRRLGELCCVLAQSGAIAIVCAIAPYALDRRMVRERHQAQGCAVFEAHIDTPLDECKRRDPKGLYLRAIAGQIPEFTGISAPYEAPQAPDMRVATVGRTPQASGAMVLAELERRGQTAHDRRRGGNALAVVRRAQPGATLPARRRHRQVAV